MELLTRYAIAVADVDELDPRLSWRVMPRDRHTGEDEVFRLVGSTRDREVDLLAIADELGVVWNRPAHSAARTRSPFKLAGQGVNRSGHRYRFVLERNVEAGRASRAPRDQVELVRVTTGGLPRRGSAERTELLRVRAARLGRMRDAGLTVVRTETFEESTDRYSIIDHLRVSAPGTWGFGMTSSDLAADGA